MPHARVLITGSRGQLGSDLVRLLSSDYEVVGTDLPELDLTDQTAVHNFVKSAKPQVIIHAAAYTDVDGCETKRELALQVNEDGTRNLAQAAALVNAKLVYYSTDYVFDGRKDSPYVETDLTGPATVYGISKLAGEVAIRNETEDYIIMRIAWVYGSLGNNFVKTILKLGRQQLEAKAQGKPIKPLKVVDDQRGNPTWTEEIVAQTKILIASDQAGLFHATSEGVVSWYQFAKDIFRLKQLEVDIEPCTTEQFPRPARRPAMSALENARLNQLGLNRMKPYIESLELFLQRYPEF